MFTDREVDEVRYGGDDGGPGNGNGAGVQVLKSSIMKRWENVGRTGAAPRLGVGEEAISVVEARAGKGGEDGQDYDTRVETTHMRGELSTVSVHCVCITCMISPITEVHIEQ